MYQRHRFQPQTGSARAAFVTRVIAPIAREKQRATGVSIQLASDEKQRKQAPERRLHQLQLQLATIAHPLSTMPTLSAWWLCSSLPVMV